MITVQDVTKAFGPKKLFEDANVSFAPGNRYGLTGPNGSGKSTFMKILSGDEDSDTGQVFRPKKLGVLKQDHFRYEDNRVIDVVLMGNGPLWSAMSEKESLLAKDSISDEDGVRLAELENIIGEEDGYTAEPDAAELLQGLGIDEPWHDQPMRALAGGYKLRVLLAQSLFGKPQALLLDEPTNNLDIDSIRWLEKFMVGFEGVLVTISHDRHFLNAICTHIADIDYESIILYPGGYDDMVRQKGSVRSRVESENAEKKKKVAQLQDFVARFSAGTRASQVQSRIRQMQKLKLDDLKRSNIAAPFIKFEQKAPSGKQTLTIDGISKTFGGNEVVKPFSALVTRGEKVCVIGKNGVGKSTLVKMLAGARSRPREVGAPGAGRLPAPGPRRRHPRRHDRLRLAARDGGQALERGDLRAAGPDALLGRGADEADRHPLRRRDGAAPDVQADALQGQRPDPRRADQPPRPPVDRGARRGAHALRGDDHHRHARPAAHRRGRVADLGDAQGGRDPRLPRHLRRLHREAPGHRDGASMRRGRAAPAR
jgi:ATPase subunit of ABC transporter with duplicated ATPase domains